MNSKSTSKEAIEQRGIYLLADTPLSAVPLAVEDGSGDRNLLAEALAENLQHDELDELIHSLVEESNRRYNEES